MRDKGGRIYLELGDHIRMSSTRRMPFEKGFLPKWTRELFVVRGRLLTAPPTYELSDEMGEPIKGKFYAHELQCISLPDRYQIEKIICLQCGRDGKVRHFVRWWGYPKKFDRSTPHIKTATSCECKR